MGRKRYRQKVELHLERSQIYVLVFAATLVTAVVFSLGIIVGKRAQAMPQAGALAAPQSIAALAKACETSGTPSEDPNVSVSVSVDPAPAASGQSSSASSAVSAAGATNSSAPDASDEIPSSPAGDGKFTLQLSSFQSRDEAVVFYKEMVAAGHEPYLIHSELPGRGTWFRVRLGAYATYEDAVAAKKVFEKRQKIIAYVTRLPKNSSS